MFNPRPEISACRASLAMSVRSKASFATTWSSSSLMSEYVSFKLRHCSEGSMLFIMKEMIRDQERYCYVQPSGGGGAGPFRVLLLAVATSSQHQACPQTSTQNR